MGQRQYAEVTWNEQGTPVSMQFDDPYFSLEDGLAETRHTFLAGNGLPARFRPGFRVAELGFGTGLNMLATALAAPAGPIQYTSFEAFPMAAAEIARALAAFPEGQAIAAPFLEAWGRGETCFTLGALKVEVILGDARQTLPFWPGVADAWYLDGFSPAKNPQLWGEDLMRAVGNHTAPDGTAASYTAAGFVRRGLEAAGFTVERRPGFGRKRHMTVARRAP
ncbi:MAG: FAD-dependent oxidoreductase [Rhodobacterales bacterium CG2_30_65_12]|nr:MAG: FAD-dependent oxidoreductase [Rhodobacterales bacterium CG2_30_65_12]